MSVGRIVTLNLIGMGLGLLFVAVVRNDVPWPLKVMAWAGVGLMLLAGVIEVVAKRRR